MHLARPSRRVLPQGTRATAADRASVVDSVTITAKLVAELLGIAGVIGLRRPRGQAAVLTPVAATALAGVAPMVLAVPSPSAGASRPADRPYAGSTPLNAHRGHPVRLAHAVATKDPLQGRHAPGHEAAKQRVVAVNPDGQHPVYVDRRPAGRSEHLVCLDHVPVVGGACLG